MGFSFSSKLRKASCFSAVSPVCGWNQCVKCVTPRAIAHSLMTCATVGAISTSSFFPRRIAAASLAYTSFGSFAFIWRAPKVLTPKYSEVGRCGALPLVWTTWSIRGRRRARSCTAAFRGFEMNEGICLELRLAWREAKRKTKSAENAQKLQQGKRETGNGATTTRKLSIFCTFSHSRRFLEHEKGAAAQIRPAAPLVCPYWRATAGRRLPGRAWGGPPRRDDRGSRRSRRRRR